MTTFEQLFETSIQSDKGVKREFVTTLSLDSVIMEIKRQQEKGE